jgi:uncharacterized membrane-anchored protein YitT (DUF2179 family)
MIITSHRHPIKDYLLIMIGTTLLAIAINTFFEPMQLVIGGVTGIAIIIKDISMHIVEGGIPLWVTNIVINIPLFVIAVFLKGKNFGGRSLFATLYLSFALFYTQGIPLVTHDILLTMVYGGILAGIGLGLVLAAFSTTGGTDLAASILQHYFKNFSVAQIMLVLDALIIIVGAFIFSPEQALYAIISIYITTKIIDSILEGIHFSKAAFIISAESDLIAKTIIEGLDRGVTGLSGHGMYSKVEKQVLLCVVSKKEIIKLKELVREIDKKAFVIVADVKEVLGEGFIEYQQ